MFGWLPIIGPIIDGIVSIWKGYQSVDIAKYTIDGKVDVAAMQATTDLAIANKDDIGTRLARDLIMFPVAANTAWVSWDNIVVYVHPELYWKVSAYPDSLAYLPYAVIMYLFGSASLSLWKRWR